jgi:hypothetical protein
LKQTNTQQPARRRNANSPPDLRIIPRPQQQQNGARAQNKTRQVATSSIEGAINLEMPENKNMQQTKFGQSP